MTFSIHNCEPMPTRPCRYCLCFNGSCVFADFELHNDCLYIVRISFDGHGCYKIDDPTWQINADNSKRVIDWIEADNVDHDEMRAILIAYFQDRKTQEIDEALAYNNIEV
jgi:hypothetical protein